MGKSMSGCSPSEREALLKFKHELKDPSKRLTTWVGDGDCCSWSGVICDNLTGHVLELHLRSLSFQEYYDLGGYYYGEYLKKSTFGGKISPSLLNLKELRFLDLSNNDFGGIQIPKFLGSIGSLRYLNLSGAGFGGMIPHELANLFNLQYLNLNGRSGNYYGTLYVDSFHWLSSLSLLEFLDLSYVDLSQSFNWLEVMNTLPFLEEVHLSDCDLVRIPSLVNVNFSYLSILDLSLNFFSLVPKWIFLLKSLKSLNLARNFFYGPIPKDFRNMTSLQELDLSVNDFNSSVPDCLFNLPHLELLSLVSNALQGKIPSTIGNMTSLASLDLSLNSDLQLEGGIPTSFKNLCNLKSLSLESLNLSQDINAVLEILQGCVSNGLESLRLSGCHLFGQLSNHLIHFKALVSLYLSSNSISGPIPLALGELMSLRYLYLDNNKLNGSMPVSLGGLTNLESLSISDNLLEGNVSDIHFAKLIKLRYFDASENHLMLRVSSDWIPPPIHLRNLQLSSWAIGPQFPRWLSLLKSLAVLDLSNSKISSNIPFWFWNSSSQLFYLNLSHNQIYGNIPDIPYFSHYYYYSTIDLSSNHFQGPLPHVSSNVTDLYLSNNLFSGSISHFVCRKIHKVKRMRLINLDNNFLSGQIRDCWSSWSNLEYIRLSNNNFSGNIPRSIGTLTFLKSLHLRNNSLSGEIPLSLRDCTSLVSLDLGENQLIGHIPPWMGASFPSMAFLNLRENKFHGHIPPELCQLASLQILDLAHNDLARTIPSCIDNLSAMTTSNPAASFYGYRSLYASASDYATIVSKGRIVEYFSILGFVKSLDLSGNNLSGDIPEVLTKLIGLQSLNLSDNLLSGRIPEDIGAMVEVEAIDFSQNQLFGEIPQSMTKLTYLSDLNLSDNNLSGTIPTGTQLQSFNASSFTGNKGLCGPPLTNNCTVPGVQPRTESSNENRKSDGGFEVNGFYVSMALGFIVGFWGAFGPLVVNRQWRHAYFHFLDHLWDKVRWRLR